MADRTNTDMLIVQFLSVTKPSRRREVKERLDALTKYDDSEFRARFRLSKLTVHHLLSELCHTVHLLSFCNIILSVYGENLGNLQLLNTATLMNDTAMASADCRPSLNTRALLACRRRLSANAETAISLPATARDPGCREKHRLKGCVLVT